MKLSNFIVPYISVAVLAALVEYLLFKNIGHTLVLFVVMVVVTIITGIMDYKMYKQDEILREAELRTLMVGCPYHIGDRVDAIYYHKDCNPCYIENVIITDIRAQKNKPNFIYTLRDTSGKVYHEVTEIKKRRL